MSPAPDTLAHRRKGAAATKRSTLIQVKDRG